MVLQPGANDLLAIVEILWSDESHHGIHQHGPVAAGNGVGPGLTGLLVNPVMGIGGKSAALSGFEIHHVIAQRWFVAILAREGRPALELSCRPARLIQPR